VRDVVTTSTGDAACCASVLREELPDLPELRKTHRCRWVIISTDRAKRPTDFAADQVKMRGGSVPSAPATRARRPDGAGYRPAPNGPPPERKHARLAASAWCQNKFPLASRATRAPAEGMFDKMTAWARTSHRETPAIIDARHAATARGNVLCLP